MKNLSILAALLVAVSAQAGGGKSYATHAQAREFAAQMAQRHGFDEQDLLRLFEHAEFQAAVVKAIMPPRDPKIRSWRIYRSRYIDARRVEFGLEFWRAHEGPLARAEQQFGVPAQIIVAIIGVETIWGRHTGNFRTLPALATLAFDYPPRAELFRGELEELLLLAREQGRSALGYKGSFAGALGLPQFLPSSYRRYAVDFDGSGEVDLFASAEDAIGSVGNFLREHGWRAGTRVALPLGAESVAGAELAPLLDAGIQPSFDALALAAHGLRFEAELAEGEKAALIDLVSPDAPTEYWLGLQNFWTITRYNRSSFYAMAVFQLAEALHRARQ
jgi:membrane-bound lytic murein transglycosylase B